MPRMTIAAVARELGRDPKTVREWFERGYLERGEDGLIDLDEAIQCRDTRDSWRVQTGADAAQRQHHGEQSEERRAIIAEAHAEEKARKERIERNKSLFKVPMPDWLAGGSWPPYEGDPKAEALGWFEEAAASAAGRRWGKRALVVQGNVNAILNDLRIDLNDDEQWWLDQVVATFEQDMLVLRGKKPGGGLAICGALRGADALGAVLRRSRHAFQLYRLVGTDAKEEALQASLRELAANIEFELREQAFGEANGDLRRQLLQAINASTDRIRLAA